MRTSNFTLDIERLNIQINDLDELYAQLVKSDDLFDLITSDRKLHNIFFKWLEGAFNERKVLILKSLAAYYSSFGSTYLKQVFIHYIFSDAPITYGDVSIELSFDTNDSLQKLQSEVQLFFEQLDKSHWEESLTKVRFLLFQFSFKLRCFLEQDIGTTKATCIFSTIQQINRYLNDSSEQESGGLEFSPVQHVRNSDWQYNMLQLLHSVLVNRKIRMPDNTVLETIEEVAIFLVTHPKEFSNELVYFEIKTYLEIKLKTNIHRSFTLTDFLFIALEDKIDYVVSLKEMGVYSFNQMDNKEIVGSRIYNFVDELQEKDAYISITVKKSLTRFFREQNLTEKLEDYYRDISLITKHNTMNEFFEADNLLHSIAMELNIATESINNSSIVSLSDQIREKHEKISRKLNTANKRYKRKAIFHNSIYVVWIGLVLNCLVSLLSLLLVSEHQPNDLSMIFNNILFYPVFLKQVLFSFLLFILYAIIVFSKDDIIVKPTKLIIGFFLPFNLIVIPTLSYSAYYLLSSFTSISFFLIQKSVLVMYYLTPLIIITSLSYRARLFMKIKAKLVKAVVIGIVLSPFFISLNPHLLNKFRSICNPYAVEHLNYISISDKGVKLYEKADTSSKLVKKNFKPGKAIEYSLYNDEWGIIFDKDKERFFQLKETVKTPMWRLKQ